MRLPSSEANNKRAKTEQENNPLDAALFDAAEKGDTQECIRLLDLGANINCVITGSWANLTPLNIAIKRWHEETILALIERGADVTIGYNDLCVAVGSEGNTETFRMLVQRGATVTSNLLSVAAWSGRTETCLLLLREYNCGSNTQELNKALDEAVRNNQPEVCIELLKWGGNPNAKQAGHYNLLAIAASRGFPQICAALLDAGANVNLTEEDKKTWSEYISALHLAVEKNHFATAELLLQRGADANDKDYGGVTPLELAEGNAQMTDLLIVFGAQDKNKYFQMSRLVEEGKIKECAALIQQACNVNAQGGKYQRTPLQLAAEIGQREICLLLLKHGANPSLCDNRGFNPLSVTAEKGHSEIFLDLIQADANYKQLYAFEEDGFKKRNESLLHIAARNGQTEICRILIERCKMPLDIGSKPYNSTPLMIAVMYLQKETCAYLIERGANVNAWNNLGYNVLACCSEDLELDDPLYNERLSGPVQKEILKMLLEKGANINNFVNNDVAKESGLSFALKEFHQLERLDEEILDMTIPRAISWTQCNKETNKVEMLNNPSDKEYNNLRIKVLFLLWVLKKCGLMERGLRFEILIRAEEFCSAAVTTALHRIIKYNTIKTLPTQLFKPIGDRMYADTITDIGNILKDTGHDVKALEIRHGEQIRENIQRTFQLK